MKTFLQFVAIVALASALLIASECGCRFTPATPDKESERRINDANNAIVESACGRSDAEVLQMQDAWGSNLQVRRDGDVRWIVTIGPDKVPGTLDDVPTSCPQR